MMVDIRLRGLAKPTDGGNKEFLEGRTGYKLVRDGGDYVIPKDDPQLVAGPSDYITVRKPLSLSQDLGVAAEVCVNSLCEGYERVNTKPPGKIPTFPKYGFSSTFYQECLKYGFMPRGGLRQHLVETLFPYMKKEFGAQHVVPIFVHAERLQTAISLAKISYLMTEFDIPRVQRLVDTDRGLDSIIPSPAHVLGYFDAFMIMSPSVIAVPIDRPGSALYFVKGNVWTFPYVATTNLLEKLQMGLDPVVRGHPSAAFKNVLSGPSIRRYLAVTATALNSTLKILSDPRNFVDPDGNMNFKRQLQTQSGIRLILHEIAEVGASGSPYIRQRLAFNVIDKFANLRVAMSRSHIRENDVFDEVFTEAFRDQLASIYRAYFKVESDVLAKKLVALTHKIYDPILTRKNRTPRTVAEIRGLRNLNHGIFLNRDQFSTVFLDGEGAMPYEFVYVPFLLGLAMLLNPKQLLGMA